MNETKYPNKTIKLLIERASCRDFKAKKIPPEIMSWILEAGVRAPSGGNLQPYSIIQIEKKAIREKLAELCCNQPWIAKAPVNLLFCIDWHRLEKWAKLSVAPFTGRSAFRNFWITFQDTIIAAQNICTAIDSLGLGSVYIGSVLECLPELKEMFQLPGGVFPVVLLCLGYPSKPSRIRNKMDINTVVHKEKYRELTDLEVMEAYRKKYKNFEMKVTDERFEQVLKVCRNAHGEEFAEKCRQKIEENGFINIAQYYFGLHYCADEMPQDNEQYLKLMENFGFDWFKKYVPKQGNE